MHTNLQKIDFNAIFLHLSLSLFLISQSCIFSVEKYNKRKKAY